MSKKRIPLQKRSSYQALVRLTKQARQPQLSLLQLNRRLHRRRLIMMTMRRRMRMRRALMRRLTGRKHQTRWFGSRVLVTQQFLLNNLDEYARKGHYPYNRFNGLFPMIATSNGKIKFAYASVGGSIDDSRSLPRTITSLLLNIFQRQKLSATLGWPLLYSFNGTTYRDGIRAA